MLLGIASRSSDAELSMSFLRLVNLPSTDGAPETALDLFDKRYIHIESTNPASKVVHLRRIKAAARGKLRFGDMLFFDDDYRNWKAVERLGASFHLLGPEKSKAGSTKVPLTVTVVDEGVRRWREKTKKGKGKKSGPKVKEKQKSTAKKKVNKKSEAKKKGNRKLTAKWTGCIVS